MPKQTSASQKGPDMLWVCITENQWVLEICHTSHIILHAQCEAHSNMRNSYATGISEIIPFGALSNRASLEGKATDLIYYQQETVTNYELFLSKLGNNLFYRSCKQAFIKSISQKNTHLEKCNSYQDSVNKTKFSRLHWKKVLTPWGYTHLSPLPRHTPTVPCGHLEVQCVAEIFLIHTFKRYTFHLIQF